VVFSQDPNTILNILDVDIAYFHLRVQRNNVDIEIQSLHCFTSTNLKNEMTAKIFFMKFKELIDKVNKIEEEIQLTECIYFGAIEKLKDVQDNLSKLNDIQHVRRVIKPFLIQWGMMGRVVGRGGLNWKKLGTALRNLEKEFHVLRDKRFLTVNLNETKVSSAIKTIYQELRSIRYIGGVTSTPKILHLLNPEMFVMWDEDIRKNYKEKNGRIGDTPEGYLEFLNEAQNELMETLEDRRRITARGLDEIEREIRRKYKNKTLARIIDEYNWITAHPFTDD